MQYSVMHPPMTSRRICWVFRISGSFVSKNASQLRLCTTGSLPRGASSGRISHPGEPRSSR